MLFQLETPIDRGFSSHVWLPEGIKKDLPSGKTGWFSAQTTVSGVGLGTWHVAKLRLEPNEGPIYSWFAYLLSMLIFQFAM